MSVLPPVALAVVLAALADQLVAEPPERLHPVVWLGRVIAPIDRDWEHPWLVGGLAVLVLPLAFATAAWGLVSGVEFAATELIGGRHAVVGDATAVVGDSGTTIGDTSTGDGNAAWFVALSGAVVAALVLFSTTSYRMLLTEADSVIVATGSDPEAARDRLPALAGRNPSTLSPSQLRSAAVESAAENLADGLVAPLVAFVLLAPVSVALGAAAAAWVKGVNTMDSMLGYRSKAVGTPAARVDDIVMWLPARMSAVLLAAAAASPDPLRTGRRWAGEPASPNAGWPMATLAAALGVRLHKPGAYDLNEIADLPDVDTARRGVRIVGRAGLFAYGTATVVGVLAWWL